MGKSSEKENLMSSIEARLAYSQCFSNDLYDPDEVSPKCPSYSNMAAFACQEGSVVKEFVTA